MTEPDATLIERIAGVRVLVVGDAMLDEYVEGEAERICPEAPVPVVRVTGTTARPGGAANAARNAAALDAVVDLVTMVGDDPAGRQLVALCAEAGIATAGIVRSESRPTTRKLRVVARNQQVLRVDWERTHPLATSDAGALLTRLRAASRPDALLLSDYAKGCLAPEFVREAISRSQSWAVPVVIDPKSPDLERYRGATVLTPNRRELAAALDRPLDAVDVGRVAELGRPLLGRFGLGHLVVTCGADGLVVVSPEASTVVPALPRQVSDVTGAGDTVVAVLAVALGAGADVETAARLANLAAGLVVERVGTAVVARDELGRATRATGAGKVLSRRQLGERLAGWRSAGLSVAFTNGCFDLLHAGHLALLREAARHGDVLLVGLNGDRSVTRLKGTGRPIVPEGARAAMLAALDCVTAVVLFDEDTPLDLIREVEPRVLVKGADYTPEQVVGRELVLGWGGEVVLVPLVPGHSTTALVAELRQVR